MSMSPVGSNMLAIKRFVPIGNVEAELKRNPSAKVFREIAVSISPEETVIELASVTRQAATGGYRNGGINLVTIKLETESVLRGEMTWSPELHAEPHSVVSKILQIRDSMVAQKHELKAVLAMMSGV